MVEKINKKMHQKRQIWRERERERERVRERESIDLFCSEQLGKNRGERWK